MVIFLISMYQKYISPLLLQLLGTPSICRFEVTCSEYTNRSIKAHGILKGSYMGLIRLMHCQPFTAALYG